MGAIAISKTNYKHLMLSAAIKASQGKQNFTLMDFLKKVTILDAIRWFGQAWADVPESAMYGIWNRVLQRQKPSKQPEQPLQTVDEIGNLQALKIRAISHQIMAIFEYITFHNKLIICYHFKKII